MLMSNAEAIKASSTPESISKSLPSRKGYQAESVREVQVRASTVRQQTSPQELRGLKRLNQALNNPDLPIRDDVPRGFYLNINV